jgi:calpain
MKGLPEPADVEWVYPETYCGKTPVQFVDDGAASADCIQGNLGDCWFISAMSVLATRDELLVGGRRGMELDPDMIVDQEIAALLSKGVYPPIFHRYRKIGLYVIRIFKNFTWIYVSVDERLPGDHKTQKPVFGHCLEQHEIWTAIIEKAYAKLHGCYENLISGYVDEGI